MAKEDEAASGDDEINAASMAAPSLPKYLLVMTATIIPAVDAGVKRADPRLRLEDYKQALRYWLCYEHPAAERILLLENSGADLGELRAIAEDENPRGKPVEFLSIAGMRFRRDETTVTTRCGCLTRGSR